MMKELYPFSQFLGVDVSKNKLDFGFADGNKTDPIDVRVIAFYGQVVKPEAQVARSDEERKLKALVERRRQLLDLINQEDIRAAHHAPGWNHWGSTSIRASSDFQRSPRK
jgi:hypothetical protein